MMWWLLAVVLSIGMLGCVFYYAQEKIVFHPSQYDEFDTRITADGWKRIEFVTEDGEQVAYYKPPPGGEVPERLWLMFCGNASLTLDNRFLAEPVDGNGAARSVGFLFVEYPGYGECDGRPSRKGIHRNVAGSVEELGRHLSVAPKKLWQNAECFGHSLGAAVAMESAATHNVEKVVAVSPFTSIEAMAARIAGVPSSSWIRNNFNNQAALDKVAGFSGAEVYIFHGSEDRIIPVAMGRALAEAHPEVVTYREIEDTEHNDILGKIKDDLRALLFR